jgi:pyruvate-formate lyase-activating enzyme
MKNNKPLISLKVISKDGRVKRVASRKTRRIFHFIEAVDFQNYVVKVSVVYSPGFSNKGVYKTKADFIYALKAFLESGP